VGELGKLGVDVAKSTVDKCRIRLGKTPSPTWRAFLKNHLNDLVSIDFLVVPTIRFKLLYVLPTITASGAESVAVEHTGNHGRRPSNE
jgi:hypothetical protein